MLSFRAEPDEAVVVTCVLDRSAGLPQETDVVGRPIFRSVSGSLTQSKYCSVTLANNNSEFVGIAVSGIDRRFRTLAVAVQGVVNAHHTIKTNTFPTTPLYAKPLALVDEVKTHGSVTDTHSTGANAIGILVEKNDAIARILLVPRLPTATACAEQPTQAKEIVESTEKLSLENMSTFPLAKLAEIMSSYDCNSVDASSLLLRSYNKAGVTVDALKDDAALSDSITAFFETHDDDEQLRAHHEEQRKTTS